MYRSSSGRSSLPSSSRSKESSSSGSRSSRPGASTSGSTRGRSPRRSRSPSPRGRRHRSPSSSRSSRRSPSARRASRVRSPSGGSRRGSEQRDGSLSRRCSPGCRSRSPGQRSPSRHSESSVEQSLHIPVGDDHYGVDTPERRRLSDRLGSPVDSLSDVERGDFADCPGFSRRLSCPQSHERCSSPEGRPPSSFNRLYNKDYHSKDVFLYQSDFNKNYDHLQDISRETDRDGKLLRKHSYSLEERRQEPKCLQYDRENSLLAVSTDPQGLLPGKQIYRKRIPSRSPSPRYPNEDYRELESSRSEKNTCQDTPRSGYVIPGLPNSAQSNEPQFLHTPEQAPAMPKKSILKKRVDDPSVQVENLLKCSSKNAVAESVNKESQACVDHWRAVSGRQSNAFPSEQNFGSFLRKKKDQESTSESADLSDDFFLPYERASQDGSSVSHVLDRMADSTSPQEKRRHSFLVVEDEEKFLYGDDDNGSNINCPSTEKLIVNGEKASVSLNKRPLSPIQSVKSDTSEGSGIEYEKIHELLKTIGLDIGVAEIGKGAARMQERLRGKKRLHSLDGPAHKADSSEKSRIQRNTPPSGSDQKDSLSPCGSSQPSNDVSSASVSEHDKSTIVLLGYDNSANTTEQSFPSVPVTPSAPASLPNLPPPPPPFSAFLAAQVLQNYPPPVAPPSYNAYGHCVASSAPAWPMYTPPQESNPALPDVHGPAPVIMPPKPTRPNLRVIETVSTVEENPEININKSVLVEVPITPTDSSLLSQSSNSGTTERTSDGKTQTSEKLQVTGDKLMSEEAQKKKLAYLRDEFHRRCKQQWQMVQNKHKARGKEEDPLLAEMKRVQENIVKEIAQLTQCDVAEVEQSHLNSDSHIVWINNLGKSWKKASENIYSLEEKKSENKKTQEKTSNSIRECLNKKPLCEGRRDLDGQAGLTPVQETECILKRKQCVKQKEDRGERSSKMARREESEITKELRDEGDQNEITKWNECSHGQKLLIRLVLKNDNVQAEKEEGEVKESQKESRHLSSEKYSLRKTETNNQSQDQGVPAPKAESAKEDKCRENQSQPGNPDSKKKVALTKPQSLGMRTKEQKPTRAAKGKQGAKSLDNPHGHLLSPRPPGPALSLVATSAADKPAPAKASDIKSGAKRSPNIAKAFSGGAGIVKSSQEKVKLQKQVKMQLQKAESISDTVKQAKVQKQKVTEAEAQKVGAAEERAKLKMVKKKQEPQTFQKPQPPLLPGPLPLLSLPPRPLLSLLPTPPHPPQLLFPFAVPGPANQGRSSYIHNVPRLGRRDKRMTGVLPHGSLYPICRGPSPFPLLGLKPSFHTGVGRAEGSVLWQGGSFSCLQTQLHGQPRHQHEPKN